jgi:hypothetical protein
MGDGVRRAACRKKKETKERRRVTQEWTPCEPAKAFRKLKLYPYAEKKGTPATIMYVWRNIAPNQEHQNGKWNSEMV